MVLLQLRLTFAVWFLFTERALASKSGCTGGYCFTMADNERLTQQNAQQWCRDNGTQLAEILNKDIQDAFTNFIQTFFNQQITNWYVFTNGGRTIGSWNRVNGNGIGSISVLEQTDSSYAYGYLRSSGSQFDIYAARPADTKGFICSGMSDCSGGVMISGQCYKSYTETVSWFDARNRCLDGGGDLATFDFITTNDGFRSLNGSWISPSSNYWIGFRREWWTWKGSSTEVKFSAWRSEYPVYRNYPNYDCICIYIGDSRQPPWTWMECDCNQQPTLLCISGNTTLSTSPSPSKTATSSTSPSPILIPSSSTLKSSTRENIHSGGFEQTPSHSFLSTQMDASGMSSKEQIGIGVGVGIGGLILVIAVVIILIFLLRKRFNSRHFAAGKQKPNPPDLINGQTNEGTYETVISSSQQNNSNADECSTENPPTVYAPLAITSPKDHSEYENIDMKASDASVLYGTVSKRH